MCEGIRRKSITQLLILMNDLKNLKDNFFKKLINDNLNYVKFSHKVKVFIAVIHRVNKCV